MLVREINSDILGHAVILVEANNFPIYNGMIGTVEIDVKRGFIFNPALRGKHSGRRIHPIPLGPSDLIEPL